MKIIKVFSDKEIELLRKVNIEIEDKSYSDEDIRKLTDIIYKDGYMNNDITYSEAERYRLMCERVKYINQVDLEKVKKYTRKEFEYDFYIATAMMHSVVWNNPDRINIARKSENKDALSENEYAELKKKKNDNSKKFQEYMQYMEEKYGKNLDSVEEYYRTIEKE